MAIDSDDYDANYENLPSRGLKLRYYSSHELIEIKNGLIRYIQVVFPKRKINTNPKNYKPVANSVNEFCNIKAITSRYICDIVNDINLDQKKSIEKIEALKSFIKNFELKSKKETTKLDVASLQWHALIPFFPAVPLNSLSGISNLFPSPTSRINNCEITLVDKDSNLYWFDYGIAVWHFKKEIKVKNIYEFSLQRRSFYKHILEGGHPLFKKTIEINQYIHNLHKSYTPLTSPNFYALSIVNLLEPLWDEPSLDTALKLFANPSMLYNDHRALISGHEINEEIKKILANTEAEYLNTGISNHEFTSFGVNGLLNGYATWAGVSLQIKDQERCLPIDDFIEFEINMQSLWSLLHQYKKLIHDNHEAFVKSHFVENKIKKKVSELVSVLPREPLIMRLFKESVINTSRLEKLYSEFKEIIEI